MIFNPKVKFYEKDGVYYVVSSDEKEILICPNCGGILKYRDRRNRKQVVETGDTYIFCFRRFRCVICGKIHTEIPKNFLPNRHYSRDCIEHSLIGSTYCVAEDSTIWRWKHDPNIKKLL